MSTWYVLHRFTEETLHFFKKTLDKRFFMLYNGIVNLNFNLLEGLCFMFKKDVTLSQSEFLDLVSSLFDHASNDEDCGVFCCRTLLKLSSIGQRNDVDISKFLFDKEVH